MSVLLLCCKCYFSHCVIIVVSVLVCAESLRDNAEFGHYLAELSSYGVKRLCECLKCFMLTCVMFNKFRKYSDRAWLIAWFCILPCEAMLLQLCYNHNKKLSYC